MLGRSNLAFAYVEARRGDFARELLQKNIQLAQAEGYSSLETYNRALLAQLYLQDGEYGDARSAIASAIQNVPGSKTYNDWSVWKLKLIIDGFEKNDLAPLNELRRLAIERKDWPALRDADLFRLKIRFDQETFFAPVFWFTSPGLSRADSPRNRPCSRSANLRSGKKSAPRFDLETGKVG